MQFACSLWSRRSYASATYLTNIGEHPSADTPVRGYVPINIKAAYLAIGTARRPFMPLFAFACSLVPTIYAHRLSARIYDWKTSFGRNTVAHQFSYRRPSYSGVRSSIPDVPTRALRRYKSLITGRKSPSKNGARQRRRDIRISLHPGVSPPPFSPSFRGLQVSSVSLKNRHTAMPLLRYDNATPRSLPSRVSGPLAYLHGSLSISNHRDIRRSAGSSLREGIMLIFQELPLVLHSLSLSSRARSSLDAALRVFR